MSNKRTFTQEEKDALYDYYFIHPDTGEPYPGAIDKNKLDYNELADTFGGAGVLLNLSIKRLGRAIKETIKR